MMFFLFYMSSCHPALLLYYPKILHESLAYMKKIDAAVNLSFSFFVSMEMRFFFPFL